MSEINKEAPKKASPKGNSKYDSMIGMLQVFVVVSIAYSTYIVALGTEGYIPKAMLVPQALYAGLLVICKFVNSKS